MRLGIDLGSTSVKVAIVNDDNDIVAEYSAQHNATVPNLPNDYHEQSVDAIIDTASNCVRQLPAKARRCVQSLHVCG